MTIEAQAEQVDLVKRSENGVISNPFSLTAERTLAEAEALMAKFRISGVPVVDANGKLIGIITNRDMKFETDMSQLIDNVMTKEIWSPHRREPLWPRHGRSCAATRSRSCPSWTRISTSRA
jgi:CBS domain-containing protein